MLLLGIDAKLPSNYIIISTNAGSVEALLKLIGNLRLPKLLTVSTENTAWLETNAKTNDNSEKVENFLDRYVMVTSNGTSIWNIPFTFSYFSLPELARGSLPFSHLFSLLKNVKLSSANASISSDIGSNMLLFVDAKVLKDVWGIGIHSHLLENGYALVSIESDVIWQTISM